MEIIEAIKEIISIPYLWPSLGAISGISVFISPILYNGDYKAATKTIIVTFGYAFFVGLLTYFHLGILKNEKFGVWSKPMIILLFVGMAYIFGLFLGVLINRKIRKKLNLPE